MENEAALFFLRAPLDFPLFWDRAFFLLDVPLRDVPLPADAFFFVAAIKPPALRNTTKYYATKKCPPIDSAPTTRQ